MEPPGTRAVADFAHGVARCQLLDATETAFRHQGGMMHLSRGSLFRRKSALVAVALIVAAPSLAANPEEAPFLAENDAAMAKMMAAMEIRPSGDIDRDFVAMMAPHHQGAIDMARAELRYGHNEQLRRIAQEIIVTQQQEIAAMHLAVGDPLPPSVPSRDRPPSTDPIDAQAMSHSMHMHEEPDVKRLPLLTALLATTSLVSVQSAWAGQAPGSASDPDVPISHRDRVYAAEQFSNTVSVTDPADNKLLGPPRTSAASRTSE